MAPEKGSKDDYTAIREKMLSGEALSVEDKKTVLGMGLQFTSNLIEKNKNKLMGIRHQDREFEDFLTIVVFFRLVRLIEESRTRGLNNTFSSILFNDLKTYFSEHFLGDISGVNDDYLISVLTESEELESYEVSPNIEAKMQLIRSLASQIVPDNPRMITKNILPNFGNIGD